MHIKTEATYNPDAGTSDFVTTLDGKWAIGSRLLWSVYDTQEALSEALAGILNTHTRQVLEYARH